jgi:hypothetical protein
MAATPAASPSDPLPGRTGREQPDRAARSGSAAAAPEARAADGAVDRHFSLVRGDLPFRIQRALGLIPARGLGVGRRALLAAVATWLPVALAAAVAGRFGPGSVPEPLLEHFGVHARLLVGIPALILGEALLDMVTAWAIPQFARRGLVSAAGRPRFEAILRSTAARRDDWRPWAVIAALVVGWTAAIPPAWSAHELNWASGDAQALGLWVGGAWFRLVARPLFTALVLGWLWRLALLTTMMARIARLDLDLVPTHADRAAGLGFLAFLPAAFAPATFAVAAVLSALWAHDVVYHGARLASFQLPLAAYLVVAATLLLAPIAVFTAPLSRARRAGLDDYGALVARHGRLVRRRWILGHTLSDDALLNAPEVGPVADTVALFDVVARTRAVPIGIRTLILIAVPILLPMLPLIAVKVPIGEALLKIVQTLR